MEAVNVEEIKSTIYHCEPTEPTILSPFIEPNAEGDNMKKEIVEL